VIGVPEPWHSVYLIPSRLSRLSARAASRVLRRGLRDTIHGMDRDTGRIAFVGTDGGLLELRREGVRPVEALAGQTVQALAVDADLVWALAGQRLWRTADTGSAASTTLPDPSPTCIAPVGTGLVIGTEQAHLLRWHDERVERIEAFEQAAGRDTWYTPWGDPADVRSIAVGEALATAVISQRAGTPRSPVLYVNVHVGGVVRSRDDGATWAPTLDIEADVHQVCAPSGHPGLVLVAAAIGLGLSRDGGDSWEFHTAGLHAQYARAVALAGDTILLSVSTGPGGRRSALYRRPLAGGRFERCQAGLPSWFSHNIDTGCLAARATTVVFGTADGAVYRSDDAGATWTLGAKGVPAIRAVALL
jgi:hypothetical protein